MSVNMPALCLTITLSISTTVIATEGEPVEPNAEQTATQPQELGDIHWRRDFDAARREAAAQKKPLLILFQEIPGCSTCRNYGNDVLRHPLIAEAAETLFIPVAIHNNKKGDDETVLKSFNEPAWNNPVVRIIDADRKPLAERLDGDHTVAGLATRMTTALDKSGSAAPAWLKLLADEQTAQRRGTQTATFAMHCFWEGEGKLGALPGVMQSTSGFHRGAEVVEVQFDPTVIDYKTLLAKACEMDCAQHVVARTPEQKKQAESAGRTVVTSDEAIRPDKEPKYYLSRTHYRFVPMTPAQSCRVNAAIGPRLADPSAWLSPRQVKLAQIIARSKDASFTSRIGEADIITAWHETCRAASISKWD